MADMELIIKISEEDYKAIKNMSVVGDMTIPYVFNGIRNGIPLPKGHGRLIDVGQCDRKLFYQQCGGADSLITVESAFDMLMSLPTIIKADTESKGKGMNDVVSRQAVIEMAYDMSEIDGEHFIEPCMVVDVEDIQKLPPVIPQPKWIPVSERLPEDGQNVLFCDNDDDIMVGYHVKGRPSTHFSQDGTYDDMKNVRAWMPLPEPYKAESE